MQIITLSDSVEEQLRRLRSEREERYQHARLAYQRELHEYDARLEKLATSYGPAFRRLRVFRGTRAWWEHRKLRKQGDPQPPEPEGPTLEEQKWQAGIEGEQRLRAELASMLSGSIWTLMRGYKNKGGEISHLLIGPVGIVALGCEHVAGTIVCTKDRWVRQKYDQSGAPVTQVPIVNRAGKSPSQQINESVEHVRELLSEKGETCDITKAVILTHPDVRVDVVDAPTIQIVLLKDLGRLLWDTCRSASQTIQIDHMIEFIKADHEQGVNQHPSDPSVAQKVGAP